MGEFDTNRAFRMLATALLVAWFLFLAALAIDALDQDGGGGELWRFRLSSISTVANPSVVLWLAVAFVLALPSASRRMLTVFGSIAVFAALLGLGEVYNQATAGDDGFPGANEVTRIALMTGGVAVAVTILAVVRDRMAALDEAELREAAAQEEGVEPPLDEPLSPPSE